MAKQYRYLVFRQYSREERPFIPLSERTIFYGWTDHKSVIKVFLQQRSPEKYRVQKIEKDDLHERQMYMDIHDTDAAECMINYVNLKSAETGEEISLFLTEREMKEAEKKIQQKFHDLASIYKPNEKIDDGFLCLNMFCNLKFYYAEALNYIGFRPPELDELFNSSDTDYGYGEMDEIGRQIDMAYSDYEYRTRKGNPIGMSVLQDISNRIIYSIESFVGALRDDM